MNTNNYTYILKQYALIKSKNITCKASTPMNAAKKFAKYINNKAHYNLSFTIQNNDTKKLYEYILTHSVSGIIVKPKNTTIK